MKKNLITIAVIIASLAVLMVFAGIVGKGLSDKDIVMQKQETPSGTHSKAPDAADGKSVPPTTTVVGGDRDAHGCIGSAGYSWCETKNKCLRVWEEKCESPAPGPVACTMDAKQCPDGSYVGRTGPNCEFVCP